MLCDVVGHLRMNQNEHVVFYKSCLNILMHQITSFIESPERPPRALELRMTFSVQFEKNRLGTSARVFSD